MRRIFYAIILVITGLQCFFPAACVYYAILHPLETVLSATNIRRQLKNSVCTFPMRRTTERATGRLTKMICIQRFSSFIGRFSGRTERPSYFSHLSRIRRPFSPKIVWNLNWGVSGDNLRLSDKQICIFSLLRPRHWFCASFCLTPASLPLRYCTSVEAYPQISNPIPFHNPACIRCCSPRVCKPR